METVKRFEQDGEQWETIQISLPTKQADMVRRASFKWYTCTTTVIRLAIRQFLEPEMNRHDSNS